MHLYDEDEQRWYCYKDNQTFLAKENRWVPDAIAFLRSLTPETIEEAKRRFAANMKIMKMSDGKIHSLLSSIEDEVFVKNEQPQDFWRRLERAQEDLLLGREVGGSLGGLVGGGLIGLFIGHAIGARDSGKAREQFFRLVGELTDEEQRLLAIRLEGSPFPSRKPAIVGLHEIRGVSLTWEDRTVMTLCPSCKAPVARAALQCATCRESMIGKEETLATQPSIQELLDTGQMKIWQPDADKALA